MDVWTAVVIIVALLVVGAIAWMYLRQRRTRALRDRFGPEYQHVARERGNLRKAEAELERREKRVERLRIRPLPADLRSRFAQLWNELQKQFVDEPQRAVVEADHLVEEVMRERGYPMADFEQRAADISVDHPAVVNNFRMAHQIAERQERGQADTEDLRRAMLCYRDLFRDLLADDRVPSEARR